jgi:3-methylcrotonyl-CoA carboxylase alpha subunit
VCAWFQAAKVKSQIWTRLEPQPSRWAIPYWSRPAQAAAADRGRSAFADARVYLERYIEKPRHVEVQLLADTQGRCVAIGDRECSVQRRHQKVLEESPAPALLGHSRSALSRDAMFDAAVRIAKEVGFEGAGTCEFILDAVGGFYFLEFNPRLQVEHGVTEMCTGLDIVENQLRIAAGEHLPDGVIHAQQSGHAIEARVYAENPDKNFMPSPGKVNEIHWPTVTPGKLRVEPGIKAGSEVTPYYDPLVAKVIVYGATRHEALLTLDRVLAETVIAPLTTNLKFLRRVLADEAFFAGQYDTSLVDKLMQTPSA